MGASLPWQPYYGRMPSNQTIITARYMSDADAIAIERVPRGEPTMLPESELVRWKASGGRLEVRQLATLVGRSQLVRHDERLDYAGADEWRATAYFIASPR